MLAGLSVEGTGDIRTSVFWSGIVNGAMVHGSESETDAPSSTWGSRHPVLSRIPSRSARADAYSRGQGLYARVAIDMQLY